jgi:hypothetical protein
MEPFAYFISSRVQDRTPVAVKSHPNCERMISTSVLGTKPCFKSHGSSAMVALEFIGVATDVNRSSLPWQWWLDEDQHGLLSRLPSPSSVLLHASSKLRVAEAAV